MSRKQSSNNALVWLWITLIHISSIPSIVFAEVNKEIMPKNAYPKSYGSVTPDINKMARFVMLLKYLKMHT